MALAEFNAPNIQLLVKDDGGTAEAARQAPSRRSTKAPKSSSGRCSRNRSASSGRSRARATSRSSRFRPTPMSPARRLSVELPAGIRRRPHRPVCDLDRQALVRRADPGQCLRHRGRGRLQAGGRAARRPDRGARALSPRRPAWPGRSGTSRRRRPAPMRCSFPTAATPCRTSSRRLPRPASTLKRIQLLGTGLWDDPRIFSDPALDGGWYAAPGRRGYRDFAEPLSRPLRPGPGAHRDARLRRGRAGRRAGEDAGHAALQPAVLTNPSGFAGIDGVFRFRADGTNQRGLAVLRVTPSGPQVIAPPPRSFGNGT